MKTNISRALMLLSIAVMAGCSTPPQGAMTSATPAQKDIVEPKPDAPLTANTRFAAGQLAESRDDLPQAITQYEACLKIDPKNQPALLRLGMVYTSLKQFDKSIDVWNRYIKTTNNAAAGYCNLGLTLELAGRKRDAELAYKAAVSKEPKNEPARVNYGLMLAREDRINDAIAQLSAVLTPAEAHYDVASVLEGEKKTDAAKEQYREALRLDPQMSDAKSRLAGLDTTLE